MPMDFFVWVIRGGGRTIAVDTGFDAAQGAARDRALVLPTAEGLAALDVVPGDVGDVVVTHMHWDHAGNHALYPAARYHLQEAEMRFCTGPCMGHLAIRRPYAPGDVAAMVHRLYADQVVFHDGDAEIAPGVTLHLIGGHSRGLQVVRVHTARGWVVLASDAAHYQANLDHAAPFPIVDRVSDMLDGFARLRALAASDDHVVPGHDPLVLRRYPPSVRGRSGIARLDLPPAP